MADDKRGKDEELSEEERQWIDKLLNPLEGPASENAYPEDPVNDPDGSGKIMNDASRAFNRMMGYVDKAADIPWTPKEVARPLRYSDEQLAEQAAFQAKWDAEEKRFDESKLKEASQLPDLEGEDLEITWDFEETEEDQDDWTVLRHGDREIWREVGMKEAIDRFHEVIWILREKYGSRLASLTPTRPGLLQLRGLGYVAGPMIAELNQELESKRVPVEPKGSIEGEDADPDLPEHKRQEFELTDAVKKMGGIDCACGWIGEATNARVVGSGGSRDILCPDCRRPLYRLTLGE